MEENLDFEQDILHLLPLVLLFGVLIQILKDQVNAHSHQFICLQLSAN